MSLQCPLPLRLAIALGFLLAPIGNATVAAQQLNDPARCDSAPPPAPDPDLFCFDLVPAPDFEGASGSVALGHVQSPFGVAVSRDGSHRYRLLVRASGLPSPEALGKRRYVAWVTTPMLRPVIRLGDLVDGEVSGEVALDKFLVLISAEGDEDGEIWSGPPVLRALSPSNRLLPLDDPMLLIGAASPEAHDHGHHGGDAWVHPPMEPDAFMPPGMMSLKPSVQPYLPDGSGSPPVLRSTTLEVADGELIRLRAGTVRRNVRGLDVAMLAFNEQQPAPLLRVTRGSTIFVDFENATELPGSIHWHGVRLENAEDGVPGLTQPLVQPGETFRYRLHLPDAGLFWYHPHHREDIQQGLGLFGNIIVVPGEGEGTAAPSAERFMILSDLLVGEEGLVQFGLESPTHATMGRFGNVLLVNGSEAHEQRVARGELVRFYLTNASNTRIFNVSFGEEPVRVVGADLGRFEVEEWVESVVIAPGERYVVEATFSEQGRIAITNRVRPVDRVTGAFLQRVDTLSLLHVVDEGLPGAASGTGAPARGIDSSGETDSRSEELRREMAALRAHLDRPADHHLVLSMRARNLPFLLQAMMTADSAFFSPVEWSGTMEGMNWATTGDQIEWILQDADTGAENMQIDWRFEVGTLAKIRVVNDRNVLHAMQHPIHLHGQRFVVLTRNGVPVTNMAWKDTFLLPVGETADILADLSNPGVWMLHCHIAEHLESGMHAVLTVGVDQGRDAPQHPSHIHGSF
jgi:suppressor of ftsI